MEIVAKIPRINIAPIRELLISIGKKLKISPSLFLRLAIVQFVIVISIFVVVYQIFHFRYKWVYDRSEQILTWHLSKKIAADLETSTIHGYWDVQSLFDKWTEANPRLEIYLVNQSGKIIADSGAFRALESEYIPIDFINSFLSASSISDSPLYGVTPRDLEKQSIYSVAPVKLGEESGYVYCILSDDQLGRLLIASRVGSLIAGAPEDLIICGITVTIVGFLVFYIITKRLRKAVGVLGTFSEGDYSKRLDLAGPNDEIKQLMQTINSMADSIESNINELHRKDSLRRELIASVSHDLRSPASIISGLTEVMLKDKNLPTTHQENCQTVLDSCQSLNRLLSELFELAKFEAKEISPDLTSMSIDELVEELTTAYQIHASKKNISVKSRFTLPVPPVIADCSMIARVLTNLLDNALRYTPEGGTITLGIEVEHAVTVSVSDTGIGIPDDQLPHVFEKFYQVKQLTGMQNGLSGLGLAIVKKIIEAHNSEIFVSSIPGSGTVFKFDLQLAQRVPSKNQFTEKVAA